jgi:ribosomal subunit interface protein
VTDGETISEVPMDIVVVGKHGNVDARLRALTVEKAERVGKFVKDVRRIEVDYAHHPTRRADDSHTCEILVHIRQQLVKGTAAASEYGAALDRALDKVEQQMRRLHARRVDSRNGTRARDGARAAANDGSPDAETE